MADVFISYSRKDLDFIRNLSQKLEDNNLKIWVDLEGIYAGEEYWSKICSGIEEANAFLFVISPNSVSSEYCRREIDHALKHNKRILPILRSDVNTELLHPAVASRQWIFFRENDDFDSAIKNLNEAIGTDITWVRAHTRLLTRAVEWNSKGRDNSFLLQGSDLHEAEEWLAKSGEKEPRPTELQTQYILASRKRATQRQRITLGAVTLGLIVALVLAVVAFFQRREAVQQRNIAEEQRQEAVQQRNRAEEQRKIAVSRQLAAQAATHLGDQLDLTLLLGVEAYQARNTIEAKNILLTGLKYRLHITALLHGRTEPASGMFFSQDGKTLASYGCKRADGLCIRGEIRLWNVATHKPIGELSVPHSGNAPVAFSPDGKTLASVTCEGSSVFSCREDEIHLWDITKGQPIGPPLTQRTDGIDSLAFSPDGKILASGSKDGRVILWDFSTRQLIGESLTGVTYGVSGLAFSQDGKTLAAADWDKTIILWNVDTQQPIGQPLTGHGGRVYGMAFSPDGKILASISDGGVVLWNVATHSLIGQPITEYKYPVPGLAFSPDGKFLVFGTQDRVIILNTATGNLVNEIKGYNVSSVASSPEGRTLASGDAEGGVMLWNINSPQALSKSVTALDSFAPVAAFSLDGETLALASCENSDRFSCKGDLIRLWDGNDHQSIGQSLAGHNDSILSLAFSPNGKTLASGSEDKTIILWNIDTEPPIKQPPIECKEALSMAFSPDGKTLASKEDDGPISLWDVSTRQPITRLPERPSNHWIKKNVAFSPDGKILASSGEGDGIILWDVSARRQISRISVKGVYRLAFSPDGKTLASAGCPILKDFQFCKQGEIRLWDVATYQQIGQSLSGYKKAVISITFSPDGKTLVSGDEDGAVILWDVDTRQPIGRLISEPNGRAQVLNLAFEPDGKTLVSVICQNLSGSICERGEIRLWDVNFESWVNRACNIANRNFTVEEWRRYIGEEPYRKTCPNLP